MADDMITKEEAQNIAKAAAQEALAEFLMKLDIDVEDKTSIIRLRTDLTYMREQRLANEEARKFVKKTLWGLLPVALVGVLAWAFGIFKNGFHDALVGWLYSGK